MDERFVLEAQRYIGSPINFPHVGYVNHIFMSREAAAEFYYDQYPMHGGLNGTGRWISDWSPGDGLRYVLVPHTGQDLELKGDRSDPAIASLERMNKEVDTKYCDPYNYVPPLRCRRYY